METMSHWSGTHFWESLKRAMSFYRREGDNLRAALSRLSVRGHTSQGDPLGRSCHTTRTPFLEVSSCEPSQGCMVPNLRKRFFTHSLLYAKIRKMSLYPSVTFYRLNKAVYVSLFPGCWYHFSKRLSEGLGREWVSSTGSELCIFWSVITSPFQWYLLEGGTDSKGLTCWIPHLPDMPWSSQNFQEAWQCYSWWERTRV